jgi:hypothetical protein
MKQRKLSSRTLRAEMLESRLVLSASSLIQQLQVLANAAGNSYQLAAPSPTPIVKASTTTVTLSPLADAAVADSKPYTNYGNTSDLLVQNNSSNFTRDDAESYLKFDLSGVSGSISKAVLTLTPLTTGRAAFAMTVGVQVLQTADDAWVEGTGGTNYASTGPITWYDSPYGAGKALMISGSNFQPSKSISIDVTQLVNQKFNADQITSFIIGAVSRAGSGQWIDFASREYANVAFRPTLTVTTSGPVTPPPTVAQQPQVTSSTSTTAQLSVLGADTAGEQSLSYTWSVTSPAGAASPVFSVNGSNAAKNTTVTFQQAGVYVFTAKISDAGGQSVTTSSVNVTVSQSLTAVAVSPSNVTLATSSSQLFAAQGFDQFGDCRSTFECRMVGRRFRHD